MKLIDDFIGTLEPTPPPIVERKDSLPLIPTTPTSPIGRGDNEEPEPPKITTSEPLPPGIVQYSLCCEI